MGNYTTTSNTAVIVKAGYLLRTAKVDGHILSLTGDLNQTTGIELVGTPSQVSALSFNGNPVSVACNKYGVYAGSVSYTSPKVSLPSLAGLEWKYVDSLPEIQAGYDDSAWTDTNHNSTDNPRKLNTPTSLYGSDYGYNVGSLLFRGHFIGNGVESTLFLRTQGGTAFGHSVWVNNVFIGSWQGISVDVDYNQTLNLPSITAGTAAVLTILIDTMGLEEENVVGSNTMKDPRGVLNYVLAGHQASDVSWKVTGNLYGEDYVDRTRGPLNEGGLYAERQGYHLPNPPSVKWTSSKPTDGIKAAGVGFYTTNFDLGLPNGYDIPLTFKFANTTASGATVSNYRVQLYVNGYQFGKYGKHISLSRV